jgi:putative transposase
MKVEAMKRTRFTEEQITYALRQVEGGTPPADVCRQLGCSEASFYIWKKRYGNLDMTEVKELRQLRDENTRLKRLVADLTLDKHILSEVVRKSSKAGAAANPGALDARAIPDRNGSCVSARGVIEGRLVQTQCGEGSVGIATANPRHCASAPEVRLPAYLRDAAARGLAGE